MNTYPSFFARTSASIGIFILGVSIAVPFSVNAQTLAIAPSPHASPCQAVVMTPGGQTLKNKVVTLPFTTEVAVGPFLPTTRYSCTWSIFEGNAGTVDILDARTGKSLVSEWRRKNTLDGVLKTKNKNWMEDSIKTPVFFQSDIGAVMVPRYARSMKTFKAKIRYTEDQSCDVSECGKPDTIEIPIRIDVKSALRAAAGEKQASGNALSGTAWRMVGMYDKMENSCSVVKNKEQSQEDVLRACDPLPPQNALSYDGVDTADFSMTFSKSSTFSAKVCNTHNGSYTLSKEGIMTFSKMGSTRMGCLDELADIENGFLNLFEEEGGSVKLSTTKTGILVLQNDFVKIELERAK